MNLGYEQLEKRLHPGGIAGGGHGASITSSHPSTAQTQTQAIVINQPAIIRTYSNSLQIQAISLNVPNGYPYSVPHSQNETPLTRTSSQQELQTQHHNILPRTCGTMQVYEIFLKNTQNHNVNLNVKK